jgi:hypothetical protein
MSQQGPILLISAGQSGALTAALTEANLFPVLEVAWPDAADAIERVLPASVIAHVLPDHYAAFADVAARIAAKRPYIPLLVPDPEMPLPVNALPVSSLGDHPDQLRARLQAALRVREAHVTMLRRLRDTSINSIPETDPIQDATALLIGRGACYPALSVALGERMGVVGALSIEAAAKHLNARDLDGIVIGDGFTPRVIDAFLTVLAEDTRFRNLPVIVSMKLARTYDLPNLDAVPSEPQHIAANALPLIRQRAFEQRIARTLRSIEAGGLIDPRTGLLTVAAFERDFAAAVEQTLNRGTGLSVARFSFDEHHPREQLDAARILSRLMRRTDFGTLRDDGSLLAVFINADLRSGGAIARRLASVMKYTMHSSKRGSRIDPDVAVEMLQPSDTTATLLARLGGGGHRAAS